MAKYDWKQLEKEYILSDCKSVSSFLKDKGIKQNGSTKTIEKVIEKESEKEANKIIQVKDVANDLLAKIVQANSELNMHLATNKRKTKTVEYDYKCNKPSKETTDEKEEIISYMDIIDRKGLKELTSALKDLNDIINNKQNEDSITQSLAETIQEAYESKAGDK